VQTGRELPAKPVLLTFDDAYADHVEHAFPVLKHYEFKVTVFVVTGHIGGYSTWDQPFGYPARALMTEAQIRRWSQQGIEFAAHTRTHRDLRDLGTRELDFELRGCKEDLVQILNNPVTSFAYPFGLYNDRVRERVMALFKSAFTCHGGLNGRRTDLHQLRRTLVDAHIAVFDVGTLGLERIRAPFEGREDQAATAAKSCKPRLQRTGPVPITLSFDSSCRRPSVAPRHRIRSGFRNGMLNGACFQPQTRVFWRCSSRNETAALSSFADETRRKYMSGPDKRAAILTRGSMMSLLARRLLFRQRR
jgi:peptidoglycan/xylan/chitin deacetylase (PgdA/CDA1 family)